PLSVQLTKVKPALAAAVTVCEPPAANVPPPVTVPAPLGETLSRNTAHTLSNNLLNVRRIKCLPEHSHHRSPQTAPTVHLITRSDSGKDAAPPGKRNACRSECLWPKLANGEFGTPVHGSRAAPGELADLGEQVLWHVESALLRLPSRLQAARAR